MKPKKFQYIDSLRGIAILLVIIVHIDNLFDNVFQTYYPSSIYQFVRNGQLGVQLFFVVSALTLTMSWYNRADEPNKIRNFFIRRFFRIAPLFYIAIIYFTFDRFLGFDILNIDFSDIPKKGIITSFLFVNGFFPLLINSLVPGGWSITVEFMFYAVCPLLLLKIKNINSSIKFTLLCLLICYFINTYILGNLTMHDEFLYYNIVSQLPIFSLGILCYWFMNRQEDTISRGSWALLAIVVFIFCYETLPYHFVYSLIFLLLVIIQSSNSYHFLSNKILAQIGKVSFSMYLVHFAVISQLERLKWSELLQVNSNANSVFYFVITYLVVFFISFLISNLSYKYIEVPGQNLGKRLIKKLDYKK